MISVLLPVFNTAAFLQECLDSLLAQTETDWELLAIDDFSTDHSANILEDYARRDARIRWLRNEHKGIAPALALAFRHSRGQLITRMDSDDRMLPHKLATLKNLLLRHGEGHIATGQVSYFSENGVGEGYRRYADWLNGLAASGQYWEEIYRECVVPSPCWMAWRNDLLRCSAFVEEDVYPEDYDLCFRWRAAGFRVVAAQETLHEWRDRPERTSRTDERYRDNTWLEMKLRWFLQLEGNKGRPLVLWGAGDKGKRLAQGLGKRGQPFHWVCNNPRKWGKAIGRTMLHPIESALSLTPSPVFIIAIASPEQQREVAGWMADRGLGAGLDYFFFC